MLAQALKMLIEQMKKEKTPRGKQSVKSLAKQGAGLSNIEITDSNIKSFERIARKYGVDFALKRDTHSIPPKWLIFFKGRDTDALTAAFSEYSAKMIKQNIAKPSILAQLNKFKEIVKSAVIDRVKNKNRGGHEL